MENILHLIKKHREEERDRPFVIGVMTELSDSSEQAQSNLRFVDVGRKNINSFMDTVAPELDFNSHTGYVDLDLQKHLSIWKGLHYFIDTLSDQAIRIRVMDISKRQLHKVLRKYKGISWDQSPIFRLIYDEELTSFGGQPFDIIIGDYEFSHKLADVELLGMLSQIMAASHCIFMSAASPKLLGVSAVSDMADLTGPSALFYGSSYASWRHFTEGDNAKYVALSIPNTNLNDACDIAISPAYVIVAKLMGEFSKHRFYRQYFTETIDEGSQASSLKIRFSTTFKDQLITGIRSLGLLYIDDLVLKECCQVDDLVTLNSRKNKFKAVEGRDITLAELMFINRLGQSLISWQRMLKGRIINNADYKHSVLLRIDEEVFSLPEQDEQVTVQQLLDKPFINIEIQFNLDEPHDGLGEIIPFYFKATPILSILNRQRPLLENIRDVNKRFQRDDGLAEKPRFTLSYDVELYGSKRAITIPFVTGVIGDFMGGSISHESLEDRKFLSIDIDNFDDRMRALAPSLAFETPSEFSDFGKTTQLNFSSMEDFSPVEIVQKVPYLKDDYFKRSNLAQLRDKLSAIPALDPVVRQLLVNPALSTVKQPIEFAKINWLKSCDIELSEPLIAELTMLDIDIAHATSLILLLSWEIHEGRVFTENLLQSLNDRIDDLDQRLAGGIESILHNDEFLKLEAAWRGLSLIAGHSHSKAERAQVRFLQVSKNEFYDDIENSFKQITKQCYDEEFGQLGGEPYGQLISDYTFKSSLADLKLLKKFAELGELIKCPILATSDACYIEQNNDEIEGFRESWNNFRSTADAKYVSAVCAKDVGRSPYLQSGQHPSDFAYKESVKEDASAFVSGVFVIASSIIDQYKKQSWFQLEQRQLQDNAVSDKDSDYLSSIYVNDVDSGIIVFKNSKVRHEPEYLQSLYNNPEEGKEQRGLLYAFIMTTIGRMIMCKWRDTVGQIKTKIEATYQINQWLQQYVSAGNVASLQKPFKLMVLEPLRDESDKYYCFKLRLIPFYHCPEEPLISTTINLTIPQN